MPAYRRKMHDWGLTWLLRGRLGNPKCSTTFLALETTREATKQVEGRRNCSDPSSGASLSYLVALVVEYLYLQLDFRRFVTIEASNDRIDTQEATDFRLFEASNRHSRHDQVDGK